MKKANSYIFEAISILAVLCIFAIFGVSVFMNTPGATQARAEEQGRNWVTTNNIYEIKRFSCAFDSAGTGLGTCTIVTATEKIYLQCVSGWYSKLTGATGCKEVDTFTSSIH
mgnify:CR=1 FL=1